jgi:putative transposase
MYHRLYAHVVWTTRGRAPIIDARVARFLCRYLRGVACQERAQILEIGLVADHVHLLVRLNPGTRLPRLMQRWKGGSAVVATRERHAAEHGPLRWSKGYSVHSVSPRALQSVRTYLRAQAEHHPAAAIIDWEDDGAEFDPVSNDEWRDASRTRVLSRSRTSRRSVD